MPMAGPVTWGDESAESLALVVVARATARARPAAWGSGDEGAGEVVVLILERGEFAAVAFGPSFGHLGTLAVGLCLGEGVAERDSWMAYPGSERTK